MTLRRVVIRGTPPQDWIDDADAVTARLKAAATSTERDIIVSEQEQLWRDDRIRKWLLQQFANKCWYSEAYDSVSSVHVDHYRPKGRAKDLDGNESEGYWWLAFDWKNYRICGQLINVKKRDVFPIVEGLRATQDPISLQLECPLLIDPVSDQTRTVSYEKDEDGCRAVPAAGVSEAERYRAEHSIELLGLNKRDRLNRKRGDFWERCLTAIDEYKHATGPLVLRQVQQASALRKLKEMVNYEAEFSSVSEACLRKHASESLMARVFESQP